MIGSRQQLLDRPVGAQNLPRRMPVEEPVFRNERTGLSPHRCLSQEGFYEKSVPAMQVHEACQGGFADCHTRGGAGIMACCSVTTHKEFLRIFWGRWVAMLGVSRIDLQTITLPPCSANWRSPGAGQGEIAGDPEWDSSNNRTVTRLFLTAPKYPG